jgi:hypothetical protein
MRRRRSTLRPSRYTVGANAKGVKGNGAARNGNGVIADMAATGIATNTIS